MMLHGRFRKNLHVLLVLCLSAVVMGSSVSAQASDRTTQVINTLEQHNQNLSSEDRQTKYCKMASSPFLFYRGSNHLFWEDFATDSRLSQFGNNKTKIWIQGDLHTDNYGSFDNDEGEIVYTLNDFDESVVADYQFDVWRMAISLVLVANQNNQLAQETVLTSDDIDIALKAFTKNHLDTAASYRGNDRELDIEFTKNNTYGRLDDFLEDIESEESHKELLDKWTVEAGERQFDLSNPKLESVSANIREAILKEMVNYGQTLTGARSYGPDHFRIKDIAHRVNAGTGSLGTPRYYVLIEAGNDSDQDDDHILDVKLQGLPTPYVYGSNRDRNSYEQQFLDNHALRHAIAYRALTKNTDDYLGWMQFDIPNYAGGYYSVRALSPYKEALDTTKLYTPTRLTKLAEQWGSILATAHARADKDFDDTYVPYSFDKQLDEATDGAKSEFHQLVQTIAHSYAEQVNADWQSLLTSGLVNNCG
ncbi:MAG: DUF2252 domain-containing protein [Leptolyngbya sp. SIO3F4]|nr:DUF2252 domain-containing protein [Leptolyngbya sp. SIO3F4]